MKKTLQLLVFVLCVGFTVASIVNVFADNSEVEKMAKERACEAAPPAPTAKPSAKPAAAPAECRVTVTRASRTPFGQSFELTGTIGTRHIRCTRSLIFAGDYACAPE